MRVYVAAPYEDAMHVRAAHSDLIARGMTPTSRWAERAFGLEDRTIDVAELRRLLARNHADVDASDAMLVLARDGAGGEMFVEAARAIACGLHVVWRGRTILSSFAEGVIRVASTTSAINELERIARSPDFRRREVPGVLPRTAEG